VFTSSTLYSGQILKKIKFSRHFLEKNQMSDFIIFRPVEAELFHADRQKNIHDEANSRLQFCEGAPKICFSSGMASSVSLRLFRSLLR
jgi:hypothetical protein